MPKNGSGNETAGEEVRHCNKMRRRKKMERKRQEEMRILQSQRVEEKEEFVFKERKETGKERQRVSDESEIKRFRRLEQMREAAKLRRALSTPHELQLKRTSALFKSGNETATQRATRLAIAKDCIIAQRTSEQLAARIADALGIHCEKESDSEQRSDIEVLEEEGTVMCSSEDENDQKMLPHETVGEWAQRLAISAEKRKSSKQSSRQRSGQLASARAKARIRFTQESLDHKAKRLIQEAERRKYRNESPAMREKRLEAQRIRARIRRDNETLEEGAKRRRKQLERLRRIRESHETSNDKNARQKSQAEYKKAMWATLSPEERKSRMDKKNAVTREKLKAESKEEKLARRQLRLEKDKLRIARLTPEEREALREKRLAQQREKRAKEAPRDRDERRAKAAAVARERKVNENGELDLFLSLHISLDPAAIIEKDAEGHRVIQWWNSYKTTKWTNELKAWRNLTFAIISQSKKIVNAESDEEKRSRLAKNNEDLKAFFSKHGEELKKQLIWRKEKISVYWKVKQQRKWESLTEEQKQMERERRNAYARDRWRKKKGVVTTASNNEEECLESVKKPKGRPKGAHTSFWFSQSFQELPKNYKAGVSRQRRKITKAKIATKCNSAGSASTANSSNSKMHVNPITQLVIAAGNEQKIKSTRTMGGNKITPADFSYPLSSASYTANMDEDLNEDLAGNQQECGFQVNESSGEQWMPMSTLLDTVNSFNQGKNTFRNNTMQPVLVENVHNNNENSNIFGDEFMQNEYCNSSFPSGDLQSIVQNQMNQHLSNTHPHQHLFNQPQQPWNLNYRPDFSALNYSLQLPPSTQISASISSFQMPSVQTLTTRSGAISSNFNNVSSHNQDKFEGVTHSNVLCSASHKNSTKEIEGQKGTGDSDGQSQKKSNSLQESVQGRLSEVPEGNKEELDRLLPPAKAQVPLIPDLVKRVREIRPKCPHCSYVFRCKRTCERHVKLVHENPKEANKKEEDTPHICKICSRAFRNKSHLGHHYWFGHYENSPSFECPICSSKHRWVNHLRKHIRIHHPKEADNYIMEQMEAAGRTFRCSLCPVVFKEVLELNLHFISCHKENCQVFVCNICGILIRMEDHITEHILRFHSQTTNEAAKSYESMNDMDDEKCLRCIKCESRFLTSQFLMQHELEGHPSTVANVRNLCTACDRPYNTKRGMEKHVNEQCPLRHIKCNWCGIEQEGLNDFGKHMKDNHPEKKLTIYNVLGIFRPYKCELCRVSVSSLLTLRNHFDVKHKSIFAFSLTVQSIRAPAKVLEQCNENSGNTVSGKQTEEIVEKDSTKHVLCTVCNLPFSYQEFHRVHKAFTKKSRTYCFICDKKFSRPTSLRHHNENVHQMSCDIIPLGDLKTTSSTLLKLNKEALSLVPMSELQEQLQIKCSMCLNELSGEDFHKEHWVIGSQADPDLKLCEFCNKSFVGQYTLTRHQKFFHPNELRRGTEVEISSSATTTANTNDLSTVVLIDNGSLPPLTLHKCGFCLSNYKTAEFLQQHLARDHPNRDIQSVHSCLICNKNFSRKTTLLRHQRAFHSVAKQGHKCPQCPVILSRLEHLTGHLKRFHQGPNADQKLRRMLALEKEKRFKCEICSKGFVTQEKLDNHLANIHCVEHFNTFCDICGKQIRPENLLQHIRHVHPEHAREKRGAGTLEKLPLPQILELISSLKSSCIGSGKQKRRSRIQPKSTAEKEGAKRRKKRTEKSSKKLKAAKKGKGSKGENDDEKFEVTDNFSSDSEADFFFCDDSSEEDESSNSDSSSTRPKENMRTPLMKIVIKPSSSKRGDKTKLKRTSRVIKCKNVQEKRGLSFSSEKCLMNGEEEHSKSVVVLERCDNEIGRISRQKNESVVVSDSAGEWISKVSSLIECNSSSNVADGSDLLESSWVKLIPPKVEIKDEVADQIDLMFFDPCSNEHFESSVSSDAFNNFDVDDEFAIQPL